MERRKNLIGRTFGIFKVIALDPMKSNTGLIRWRCLCPCGNIISLVGAELCFGRSARSCTCKNRTRTKHGMRNTLIYGTWARMIQRCENIKHQDWKYYGGRGITVCQRWSGPHGFMYFFSDMGFCPKGKSIDRIDNNGNYEPENCRWATRSQQEQNKRTKKLGKTHAIK